MAAFLRIIIVLLLVALIVAFVFLGMRIHFEAIPAYFRSGEQPPVMVDLKLKNGQQVVTPLVEETPSQVFVLISGAKISFTRDEISSMQILSKEMLASGAYGTAIASSSEKKPVITFKEEDRLIDLDKIRKDQLREEKMFRKMGEQRQRDKKTEAILDKYARYDAEAQRRAKSNS